ncbi:MAG: CARDB domain-containing protein, partial [Candidatus Bipolaricaulia bacterium]
NTNFYDGRGAVAEIAADARNHGILWVNAAGNYAEKHWKGYCRDNDRDGWCEFSGNDEDLDLQVRGGDPIQLYLTWNDWPASAQDYDLYLFDGRGSRVALSDRLQTGTEKPIEQLSYRAPSSGTYRVKVKAYRVSSGRELALFSLNHDLEHAVPQASIVAPGNSSSVVTVGAIDYRNWTSGPAEPYSSQGPTGDGRSKPDLVAPDRVLTSTLGRFMGTSAAAPHVAGAAALLLSENPAQGAGQLAAKLKSQAIAMGSALVYGAGRLNLTPQPVQRPDLTITNVDYSPQNPTIGSTLNFTVRVKNQGSTAAGGFVVELRDSSGREQRSVGGLAPGQLTQVSFARRISAASETYTITVDSQNQVAESDEGNNTAEVRVTAGSQPPPPPPPTSPSIDIWTDRSSYQIGERLTLGFEVRPRSYVYIYDIDPSGQVFQVFPSSFSRDNYIEGRHTLPDGPYALTINGPAGREYLQAVASSSPIELGMNGLRNPALLDPATFRSEVARRLGTSSGWAVDWTSFQVGGTAPPPPSNR